MEEKIKALLKKKVSQKQLIKELILLFEQEQKTQSERHSELQNQHMMLMSELMKAKDKVNYLAQRQKDKPKEHWNRPKFQEGTKLKIVNIDMINPFLEDREATLEEIVFSPARGWRMKVKLNDEDKEVVVDPDQVEEVKK